ncbi:hypothetical protein EJ06DRAFT_120594 [Trichodelitschia bisporula]|uniref:Uncharacterized protein n=1 Tax=Trichodelitschia bisporula TaxID=703511 RepID=A0A6G1HQB1_9PEZI|nr:hypothetical protein EJ06DRAFT_120594 [Trichodelitschia bisporula]
MSGSSWETMPTSGFQECDCAIEAATPWYRDTLWPVSSIRCVALLSALRVLLSTTDGMFDIHPVPCWFRAQPVVLSATLGLGVPRSTALIDVIGTVLMAELSSRNSWHPRRRDSGLGSGICSGYSQDEIVRHSGTLADQRASWSWTTTDDGEDMGALGICTWTGR